MRVGVFGGSFHPPHMGHAMVAWWLKHCDRVDEVWLVPVFDHAFSKDLAPFASRVAWCEALTTSLGPWARVSTVERELERPNYSLRMLQHLSAAHPQHSFHLVVGADVLQETSRWHKWDEIVSRFPPVMVGRGGYPAVDGAPTFPEISSTLVRQRLAEGADVSALVPRAVLDVMQRQG